MKSPSPYSVPAKISEGEVADLRARIAELEAALPAPSARNAIYEECAKIAEATWSADENLLHVTTGERCAAAIRAAGEKKGVTE